ncbi:MAG: hypothetical protein IJU81_09030 [Bacteroidales bacterium]|nr:hypothetical protein [Bacteroidales bacterium]
MDMMSEQEFDALWQRAEAAPHTARLLAEYPAWRRNRSRTLVAASLITGVAIVISLLNNQQYRATDDNYTVAYCNQPDIADQYWVDMANTLLMEY